MQPAHGHSSEARLHMQPPGAEWHLILYSFGFNMPVPGVHASGYVPPGHSPPQVRLDQLQEQWGAYLAYDALQGHLTLVTGV